MIQNRRSGHGIALRHGRPFGAPPDEAKPRLGLNADTPNNRQPAGAGPKPPGARRLSQGEAMPAPGLFWIQAGPITDSAGPEKSGYAPKRPAETVSFYLMTIIALKD